MNGLNGSVIKTKSGLYIRFDEESGLYVFNPFIGLFFGVHLNDAINVCHWLQKENSDVTDEYKSSLGIGWFDNNHGMNGYFSQLLPNGGSWKNVSYPSKPLLINWLITGRCTNDCVYCYAKDEMHDYAVEPSEDELKKVADTILSYQPLAVVLSGGEPLLSSHLFKIIDYISDKVGVYIDTNGYLLEEKHISYFKKKNVVVRLSIDSLRPSANNKIRPLREPNEDSVAILNRILNSLSMCMDKNVTTVVHTVTSKENMNDLVDIGERLLNIGLKVWRVMVLDDTAMDNDKKNKFWYSKEQAREKAYRHFYNEVNKKNWYNMQVLIRSSTRIDTNNVILVNTKGEFKMQTSYRDMGKIVTRKVPIDITNPCNPQFESTHTNNFVWYSHYGRYLNFP